MNNLWFALEGAWHVLLAGLVLGAGLPAVFSLGIRALSYGAHQNVDAHTPHRSRRWWPPLHSGSSSWRSPWASA